MKPEDNSGLLGYCEGCGKFTPLHIEEIRLDALNPYPWGDVVCTQCAMVIFTFSAYKEGRIKFHENE